MFTLPHDPRLWPNQPGFGESLSLFILYAYMLVVILGDCWYTGIGISKGFTEGNPLNHWLFPKWGQAFTTWAEAAAVTVVGGVWMAIGMPEAFIFWGGIAALETWMIYRNRKLLGYKKPGFLF